MKSLTWAMLKEKIEQMNEQEQQEPVRVWGEEISLKSEITLDRTNKICTTMMILTECVIPKAS